MMIVIRVGVPKRHAKGIKIKDVIGVSEGGTHWKLKILSAYLDTKAQPNVKIAERRSRGHRDAPLAHA